VSLCGVFLVRFNWAAWVVWITNDAEMVEGEPTDDLVHLLGMVDTAMPCHDGVSDHRLDGCFPILICRFICIARRDRWFGIDAVANSMALMGLGPAQCCTIYRLVAASRF
jgi:hypothetical protein